MEYDNIQIIHWFLFSLGNVNKIIKKITLSMIVKMNKLTLLLLIALSFFIASCSNTSVIKKPVNYYSYIGYVDDNCLVIDNTDIPINTKIDVVSLYPTQKDFSATVLNKTIDSNKCSALAEIRRNVNISEGRAFYIIETEEPIKLGIAIKDNVIDIKNYKFEYCNSYEGINFTVRGLNKNKAEAIWAGYYYYGYGVESSNCK